MESNLLRTIRDATENATWYVGLRRPALAAYWFNRADMATERLIMYRDLSTAIRSQYGHNA